MTTRSEDAMARKVTIEEMWAAGHTMREIGEALGCSSESVSVTMVEMRQSQSWDLPYRQPRDPS
jgi:DNA-binding NarL/FixJ family response regulator